MFKKQTLSKNIIQISIIISFIDTFGSKEYPLEDVQLPKLKKGCLDQHRNQKDTDCSFAP